jgi:hypothetical protein
MRRVLWGTVGFVVVLLAATSAQTALFSKRYQFEHDVILEMSATTPDGLRLDSVRFKMPATTNDRLTRTGGLLTARVAVSNTADKPHKAGLAIALFDDEGRLLAVASGGSRFSGIKPGRQKMFTLVFEWVNAQAHKASTFHISLESKP